jgi:ribonucleoside-triphosphate reductase|tara:strand:- start:5523 stop:5699 length:177 start_codon:yes stop_codon:yes gene_type:complete
MTETLLGTCQECGSDRIEIMTRVTGFFSKVNGWNKGKIGELRNRADAKAMNKKILAGA